VINAPVIYQAIEKFNEKQTIKLSAKTPIGLKQIYKSYLFFGKVKQCLHCGAELGEQKHYCNFLYLDEEIEEMKQNDEV
jgi:hypothetical protein